MSAVMRMDVTSYKKFALLFSLVIAAVVVGIILGAVGPQIFETFSYSAYSCPGGSHIWNPGVCTGVTLSDPLQAWETIIPPMNYFNKQWILDVTPYKFNSTNHGFIKDLAIQVSLWGSDSAPSTNPDKPTDWITLRLNDDHSAQVECINNDLECATFPLINEEFVKYSYYKIQINFQESEALQYIGDVEFQVLRFEEAFGIESLILRIIFLVLTLAVLCFYTVSLVRSLPNRKLVNISYLTFEQKSLWILLIFLIFYNDPFYGFSFLPNGWAITFLNSTFETMFIGALILFWLITFEKIGKNKLQVEFSIWLVLECLSVLIFISLAFSLFSWDNIRAAKDPVYSNRGGVSGMNELFWVVASIYSILLVWVAGLIALSALTVLEKKYLNERFAYVCIPTIGFIIAIILGIFAGTIGPFNRGSLGIITFLVLYNVYVWLLTFGAWPVREDTSGLIEQRRKILISNTDNNNNNNNNNNNDSTDTSPLNSNSVSFHDEL